MPGGGASVFEVEHHHLAVLHGEQVDETGQQRPARPGHAHRVLRLNLHAAGRLHRFRHTNPLVAARGCNRIVSSYYGQQPRERRGEAPRAERPERLLLPKPSEVLQLLDAMVRQAVDPHNGERSDRCGQDGREDEHSARGRVVLGQSADEGHVNPHENAEDKLQPPNLFLDAVDLCHVCSAET